MLLGDMTIAGGALLATSFSPYEEIAKPFAPYVPSGPLSLHALPEGGGAKSRNMAVGAKGHYSVISDAGIPAIRADTPIIF